MLKTARGASSGHDDAAIMDRRPFKQEAMCEEMSLIGQPSS